MHLIPLCSHDTADHPPLQRLHLLQSKGFPQKVALLQCWRSHLQSQKLSRVVLVQHFVSLFLNFQKNSNVGGQGQKLRKVVLVGILK